MSLLAAPLGPQAWAQGEHGPPTPFLRARHGAVATDSIAASSAGVEVLKAGGNAVDAACAAALALGVVDPYASGLGGGGFALVYWAKTGEVTALDFRESAPAALPAQGAGNVAIPPQGALSVGVPGEARGLAALVRRFGAHSFARCTESAVRLAHGFTASAQLARQIKDEMERHPESARALIGKLFSLDLRRASAIKDGARLKRPALAHTLEALRRQGGDAFYEGPIAQAIVESVRAKGGVLTLDDLARYKPVERVPLETKFFGKRILTMPPPSAGGIILIEALGTIAPFLSRTTNRTAKDAPESPLFLHALAESLKHGFADRARYLGDPGYVEMPLFHLLHPAYHRALASRFHPRSVLPHDTYGTPSHHPSTPARDGGTAHISVVDADGNAVALTTTINLGFGAGLIAGETGILLNDELDDFSAASGAPDVFALTGGSPNFPAPGKRPVSSMTPTLVLGDAGIELVLGGAGGPRIISATLQVLLQALVFGRNPGEAVAAARIHHQWEPDLLFYEPGISAKDVEILETKGQHCRLGDGLGKVNLIVRTSGGLEAASDWRSGGAPAGY